MTSFIRLVVCVVVWGIGCGGGGANGHGRWYMSVVIMKFLNL